MTNTAQVIGTFAKFFTDAANATDGSPLGILKYTVAGLAFLASPIFNQELSELVIAVFHIPWLGKIFVPKIIASAVSGLMVWSGCDSVTAAAAGLYICSATSWVNKQDWALEMEEKFDAWRKAKLAGTSAPKVPLILVLIGMGLLAGHLKAADEVAIKAPAVTNPVTATGWLGGPSTVVTGALMSVTSDGRFLATPETAIGAQYGLYRGDYSETTSGGINFEPVLYTALGVGISAGIGDTRPVAWAAVGYRDFGAVVAWNVGSGQPPLVGVQATIPLIALIHGLDCDFGNTVKKNFPDAKW